MIHPIRVSKDLALPAELQTQTSAILGIRGSGKSTTATCIVEDLCEVRRAFVWIDPLDVAWGLKSSLDGKRPGYPVVVAGGAHGDVPLAESDGATLADFVVEHSVPLILSLRHLRKAAQRRFVTDFSEQLYHRKGETKHRTPLLVVIDECDSFIPQRVGGAEARMVGAIEDLVRRGRSAGIGVVLISQRAASINKDVLTQIELMIAHRHTSPQDRSALALWIDAHDTQDRKLQFLSTIASLKQGDAWFWAPTLDLFRHVQVRHPRTFDSRATPAPGQSHAAPKSLAEVDLDAIRSKLANTIEQARADDPKELRKRIGELERELKARPTTAPADVRTERIEVPVLSPQLVTDLNGALDRMLAGSGEVAVAGKLISDAIFAFAKRPVSQPQNGIVVKKRDFVSNSVSARPAPSPTRPHPSPVTPHPQRLSEGERGLGKAESAILRAAYWLRDENPSKAKLAFYADYSSKSSGTDKALSNLRTAGLLSGMRITPEGIDALGQVEDKPSGSDLREWLRRHLGQAENALLDALIEAHPARLSKQEVAERSGYSDRSSGTDKALSNLRTIEAAEGGEREGGTKAADVFFE